MKYTRLYCIQWIIFLISNLFASTPGSTEQTAPHKKQNVLFIICDDLRANALASYGNTICKTPNLDELAKRSVIFDRAYCQGTWCKPSRQSLMTSRYIKEGSLNMGEYFKKNGYYTARVGKIFHMKVPGDIIAGTDGLDVPGSWTERFNSSGLEAHTPGDYACLNLNIFTRQQKNRQSTAMPHRMFVTVKGDANGSKQPDYKTADKTIELLNKHHKKPFFLAVGFVRPHYPMVAPKSYFEVYPLSKIKMPKRIPNDLEDIPRLGRSRSNSKSSGIGQYPDNQKRMWAGYYASITFLDDQLGRILKELDRLQLRDQTTIVFTSDHGYHLGDHGFWEKSNLHEEVTRVPLLIAGPQIKPGRSASITELVDLYPTLTDLSGLSPAQGLEGKSMLPILKNKHANIKVGALSYTHPNHGFSWRSKGWAYMRYRDGSEELYNMNEDPEQFHNLANHSLYKEVLEQERRDLNNKLKELKINFF